MVGKDQQGGQECKVRSAKRDEACGVGMGEGRRGRRGGHGDMGVGARVAQQPSSHKKGGERTATLSGQTVGERC